MTIFTKRREDKIMSEEDYEMKNKITQELWSVTGKYGCSKNAIYGIPANPLTTDAPDHTNPSSCIFTVTGADGNETGYLFDNKCLNGTRVSDSLTDFIENGGKKQLFYKQRNRKVALTSFLSGSIEIQDFFFSKYYGIALEAAKAVHVDLISYEPCYILGDVIIYDLSKRNLTSDRKGSPKYIAGSLLRKTNSMGISITISEEDNSLITKVYWTEYVPELYAALQHIRKWRVASGALIALFPDGSNKHKDIAFSEIVWMYHQGKLDMDDFIDSIIENHNRFMEAGMVVDHLTHYKENNYCWALTAIPKALNNQMTGRDQIKAPFYFFTVFDDKIGQYKVKFGVYGYNWERKYLFNDLTYQNPRNDDVFTPYYKTADNRSLYSEVFTSFKNAIGTYKRGKALSYLNFWADPERVYDEHNILTAMLDEPAEQYIDALEMFCTDNWDDMPTLL